MDYILIILIGILIAALAITWVKCIQINKNMKEIENELTRVRTIYHSTLYDNCVLVDKIEKIKNLNLIDYSNNDYYKELLTVNNSIN